MRSNRQAPIHQLFVGKIRRQNEKSECYLIRHQESGLNEITVFSTANIILSLVGSMTMNPSFGLLDLGISE